MIWSMPSSVLLPMTWVTWKAICCPSLSAEPSVIFDSEEERLTFVSFCLASMQHLFDEYCKVFFECWNEDAKPVYQGVEGMQDYIRRQLLKDTIGFCASSNIFRCAGGQNNYPEYDDLTDPIAKRNATILSILMDHHMIISRDQYSTAQEWMDDLLTMLKEFRAKI